MASHKEMHRIANDLQAVRSIAKSLLAHPDQEWTDWELDFLDSMLRFKGDYPLTIRQCESLLELRDGVEEVFTYNNFSIAALIEECRLRSYLLEEPYKKFILALQAASATSIKRRQLGRFLRCCRVVSAVEDELRLTG